MIILQKVVDAAANEYEDLMDHVTKGSRSVVLYKPQKKMEGCNGLKQY